MRALEHAIAGTGEGIIFRKGVAKGVLLDNSINVTLHVLCVSVM